MFIVGCLLGVSDGRRLEVAETDSYSDLGDSDMDGFLYEVRGREVRSRLVSGNARILKIPHHVKSSVFLTRFTTRRWNDPSPK